MDSLNKYLRTEVLASSELLEGVDGLHTREVGSFRLKGKAQPVVVYELIGMTAEADPKQRTRFEEFADALAAFRALSWDVAAEKFKALVLRDSDGPAYYYLQLCSEYQKSPPEAWDGIVPLSEK